MDDLTTVTPSPDPDDHTPIWQTTSYGDELICSECWISWPCREASCAA